MFVFWKKKVRFLSTSYITSVKRKHCYRNTFYFPFSERKKASHAQFASLNTFENDIANGTHANPAKQSAYSLTFPFLKLDCELPHRPVAQIYFPYYLTDFHEPKMAAVPAA
jgi:hypothetical protein